MKYGVDKVDIFQTNDLSEKKDVANVTNTLYALGRAVSNILLESHTILRFLFQLIWNFVLHNKQILNLELDNNIIKSGFPVA